MIRNNYTLTVYDWFIISRYPKPILNDYISGNISIRKARRGIKEVKNSQIIYLNKIDNIVFRELNKMGEWLSQDEIK